MATMQDFPSAGFLQAPLQAPPAVVADPKLVQLKSMFPDIEADVLEAMLMYHQGDVERAVSMILETTPSAEGQAQPPQADVDEALARALQQQLDLEVAQTVNAELQEELRAEDAARRRNDPAVRAASAVESAAHKAAAGAKQLLARAATLRKRGSSSTHATRLLDAPADESNVASSWAPLSLPAYSPNYNSSSATDGGSSPSAPAVDISEPSAAPNPSLGGANSSSPPASRYSARMERARTANQHNQRSSARLSVGEQPAATAQVVAPSPPAAPQPPANAQVEVPVGELI